MALSFLYRLALRLFEILRLRRMSDADEDIEILVLRHQLDVLRRQVSRPRFEPADRALLSLLGRFVPRRRWSPSSSPPMLRWHRDAGSDASQWRTTTIGVRRRDVLGGLLHEYEAAA